MSLKKSLRGKISTCHVLRPHTVLSQLFAIAEGMSQSSTIAIQQYPYSIHPEEQQCQLYL
ncbi:hypothetical protein QGP82_01855 [Leptothoe sp. LEGE 181152]|uniref:hypothetical protein n=1 Tax=Adonisia turfae TaxID=2950184 RepID=UPI0013D549EE|nr:hypothetical protein [Adonisia turfae]MDV3347426.1 hypothetical protein [Leptothoe sp. LEGE 181152]